MKTPFNINLAWTDTKNFDVNPKASKSNVNVVSSYSLNGMNLVDIYECDGFYKIDGSFVPGQFFGGDYDSNRFRKIDAAKKYVVNHVTKWLRGENVEPKKDTHI